MPSPMMSCANAVPSFTMTRMRLFIVMAHLSQVLAATPGRKSCMISVPWQGKAIYCRKSDLFGTPSARRIVTVAPSTLVDDPDAVSALKHAKAHRRMAGASGLRGLRSNAATAIIASVFGAILAVGTGE